MQSHSENDIVNKLLMPEQFFSGVRHNHFNTLCVCFKLYGGEDENMHIQTSVHCFSFDSLA